MKCRQVSRWDPYSYKEQSFHCSTLPTNSAPYPKERPNSKILCPERANVKAVADKRHRFRAPGCATARPNLEANTLYCIKFQGPASNRPSFQHTRKSVGPMVFLAARANLAFPKDATLGERYGTPRIAFFDQLSLAPLPGAGFCRPMVQL